MLVPVSMGLAQTNQNTDYRAFIKKIFIERLSKNPRYSLRAMAQSLGIAPSMLSDIFNGRKNLSLGRAVRVAEVLCKTQRERDWFYNLVELSQSKRPEHKEFVLKRLWKKSTPRPGNLDSNLFSQISDWYYAAIIEMSALDQPDLNPVTISRALGINRIEADAALEKITQLGLLKQISPGRWVRKTDFLVSAEIPTESLRKFHTQIFKKATESLHLQSPQKRITRTETLAINADDLEDYKTLVEDFVENVSKLAAKSKKRNKVYHLMVQFFSLIKEEKP